MRGEIILATKEIREGNLGGRLIQTGFVAPDSNTTEEKKYIS